MQEIQQIRREINCNTTAQGDFSNYYKDKERITQRATYTLDCLRQELVAKTKAAQVESYEFDIVQTELDCKVRELERELKVRSIFLRLNLLVFY